MIQSAFMGLAREGIGLSPRFLVRHPRRETFPSRVQAHIKRTEGNPRRLQTMGEALRRLKEQARALNPAERLDLVEDVLANLEDLDRALSAEWAAEARDRLAAYRSGELAAVGIEDVIGSSRRS